MLPNCTHQRRRYKTPALRSIHWPRCDELREAECASPSPQCHEHPQGSAARSGQAALVDSEIEWFWVNASQRDSLMTEARQAVLLFLGLRWEFGSMGGLNAANLVSIKES